MPTSDGFGICGNDTPDSFDINALTDLEDVTVDNRKSVIEKMESFAEQVKDPYIFKVGGIAVELAFTGDRDFPTALSKALCSNRYNI